MSIEELANIIPVRPPTVNKKIKPKAQIIDDEKLIFPP